MIAERPDHEIQVMQDGDTKVKTANATIPSRKLLSDAIGEIYKAGMTTTSGGNFSVRDEDDLDALWITPSGVDKGQLAPEDMLKVLADDTYDEGGHRPSSEFPIHRSIYQKRSDVKAIIHAHPPALVAYALARKSPNLMAIPLIERMCGHVRYADYRLPGSSMLGQVIADEFEEGANVVIMENHGVAVAGASMDEALRRLYAAEFCAQTVLDAAQLGGAKSVDLSVDLQGVGDQVKEVSMVMGADLALIRQVQEMRLGLASLIQRAYRQKLLQPYYGVISQRIDKGSFLICPDGVRAGDVVAQDLVWMCGGKVVHEEGESFPKEPASNWQLHEEIYLHHPEVDSIIVTQSPALMAHAVAQQPLDVTTNPESWVFVREVAQLPYGAQVAGAGNSPGLVAQRLNSECPAVLIDNEGIVVVGGPLMQTFDRLEVSEFTAQSILLAKSIGSAVVIEADKIIELRQAFC